MQILSRLAYKACILWRGDIMRVQTQKPKNRSKIRLYLGKTYFTFKRYLYWLFGGEKFAKITSENFRYIIFSHSSPLLRKLKDVDMYLQYNKIENLKIAVKNINKITLYPGETLSYWKAIGKPTKGKGYKKGMVLQNGTFYAGTGGGLCQLSNLIFWMTIHTPLTVIERHRHGYDVFPDSNRTQPFGSGATCFYNYGDLIIKNNTDQIYQFVFEITENDLNGCIMSDKPSVYQYEVYEKEHMMQPEFWGGYTRHNTIFRKVLDSNGNILRNEFVAENHAIMMYAPFLPDATK